MALAAPYGAAVAARFPEPAVRYQIPSLAAGRDDFSSAAEVGALMNAIAARPDLGLLRISRISAGRSQQGEAIDAWHFSTGAGRPTVLLVAQQHGDEPAGAEALLAVAQQLAGGTLAPVLAGIDVVLLPRANPDGALWSNRLAANGLDINRDHLLLRTPEALAQAELTRTYRPVVVVDLHEHTAVGRYLEKFGAIQRNDMLLQYAMTANLPKALTDASENWFRQPLLKAMAREGLSTEWYYTNPTTPTDLRLNMGGVQPDTGRNVNGLKNAVSILLESRGVGLGKLHLARRIHSHVVAVRSILQSAAINAPGLQRLQQEADAQVVAQACQGRSVVLAGATELRHELLMLDPVTGADKPVLVDWNSALLLRPLVTRARPCGYWLDGSAQEAVDRLRQLGVQVQSFEQASSLEAEIWLEQSRREIDRPDVLGKVADGQRKIVLVQVALQAQPLLAPRDSWYVSLGQPMGGLVFAALEPDSQNSYFANRLLADLSSARRVMLAPARGMLAP